MVDWNNITTTIGDRTVNLGQEMETFSDKIADLCITKRRQQAGEKVDIEDWMIRLRSPEDVIERMFKKEKIKTLMNEDRDIVDSYLARVKILAIRKYIERCK